MKRTRIFTAGLILGLIGLGACSASQDEVQERSNTVQASPQPQQTQANQATTPQASCRLIESGFGSPGQVNVRAEEVVSGLDVPWGIGFLPNGDMLVSERSGQIRLVQNGTLRPQAVATINVSDRGEGGLLGLATHPDFTNNRFFYVYFTADGLASQSS
jgi:aldose sugar dehydrogenase